MNVAMPRFVDWLITLLVIAFVVAYLWYVVSLFARKAARKRPRTALYNRFGQRIATEENPDYHVLPSAEEAVEAAEAQSTARTASGHASGPVRPVVKGCDGTSHATSQCGTTPRPSGREDEREGSAEAPTTR